MEGVVRRKSRVTRDDPSANAVPGDPCICCHQGERAWTEGHLQDQEAQKDGWESLPR